MAVLGALVGGLPRPIRIGRLMAKYRDGKVAKDVYEERLRAELSSVLARMARYGLRLLVNSLFLWDDLFEPFARSFSGVRRGGLYRFLDTNFYYRVPVIEGRIAHRDATADSFRDLLGIADKLGLGVRFKAVMPGPYTFLKMSENRYYDSPTDLVVDIGRALGEEARALSSLGAEYIELHEPMLTQPPVDFELLKAGLNAFTSICNAKVWLATYFGSVALDSKELEELDVDVLGLDLAGAPTQLEKALNAGYSSLGLGLIDSRSTRVERVAELRRSVHEASKHLENVFLTPNAMMDFIPVSVAYAKLRKIGLVVGGGL